MTKHEKAVRDAAAALHDAIVAGSKAGLRVDWPTSVEGLPGIAISETAKAQSDEGAGQAGKSAATDPK